MSEQAKPIVTFNDFTKLDIRVAKVTGVSDHPNADKLIVMDIDLGAEQRQIIAGVKPYCDPQSLVGKSIVVVTNLEPAQLRGVKSEGMLLAAQEGEKVVVLTTLSPIAPGARVT